MLFIYWGAIGIRDGDVFVVEPVSRDENPVLFWLTTAMWAGLGVWAVVWDLAWRLDLNRGAWYGG